MPNKTDGEGVIISLHSGQKNVVTNDVQVQGNQNENLEHQDDYGDTKTENK